MEQELTSPEGNLPVLQENEAKNITWESNHQKIITAITDTMKWHAASPPNITEISKITGLSRKTVYQHIKEYADMPAYKDKADMFGLLQFDVVMRLGATALTGDIKAIRLYLELTGALKKEKKVSHNFISNNNNVQVNGMLLNNEVINKLNPEQLKKIEEIINPATETETGKTIEGC